MRYQGKTALITGAGAGIGRAIAERLGAEGAAVVAVDRDPDGLARTEAILEKAGVPVLAAQADVTDEAAIGAALAQAEDRFGRLDVLVNNAAFTIKGSIAETGPDDWDAEVAVTLKGPYICARAALPGMTARGGGVIINIGSVNGLVALGNPAYSAAKAGLLNYTLALATEYGPKGLRANMVSPGTVRTEAPTWRIRLEKDPEIFEKLARWYPVGRVAIDDDHRRPLGAKPFGDRPADAAPRTGHQHRLALIAHAGHLSSPRGRPGHRAPDPGWRAGSGRNCKTRFPPCPPL